MMMDYVTTTTREWAFETFCNMTELEFAEELTALKAVRDEYLKGSEILVDSFIREYLDDMYDIARDALVYRFMLSRERMIA